MNAYRSNWQCAIPNYINIVLFVVLYNFPQLFFFLVLCHLRITVFYKWSCHMMHTHCLGVNKISELTWVMQVICIIYVCVCVDIHVYTSILL